MTRAGLDTGCLRYPSRLVDAVVHQQASVVLASVSIHAAASCGLGYRKTTQIASARSLT